MDRFPDIFLKLNFSVFVYTNFQIDLLLPGRVIWNHTRTVSLNSISKGSLVDTSFSLRISKMKYPPGLK